MHSQQNIKNRDDTLMFEGICYICVPVPVVGVIVRAGKFPGNYSVKNNTTSSFPT
jgi:hypothetical protein